MVAISIMEYYEYLLYAAGGNGASALTKWITYLKSIELKKLTHKYCTYKRTWIRVRGQK